MFRKKILVVLFLESTGNTLLYTTSNIDLIQHPTHTLTHTHYTQGYTITHTHKLLDLALRIIIRPFLYVLVTYLCEQGFLKTEVFLQLGSVRTR